MPSAGKRAKTPKNALYACVKTSARQRLTASHAITKNAHATAWQPQATRKTRRDISAISAASRAQAHRMS